MSTFHALTPALPGVEDSRPTTEFTLKLTPFDQRHYRKLTAARAETIRRVVSQLKPVLRLDTALDAGCGVGFFSQTLEKCGLHVCGFDGREENIIEARKRFPHLPFETADIQDRNILELGRFDLVLCCGLLYHLESPLLAMRNLRALTEKCLLLESMCIPDEKPSLLLREEPRSNEQSLTDMACYPSEGGLVKMLYRAGFAVVYRVTPLPEHDDFRDTPEHTRKRTVLLASSAPIDIAGFRLYPEPRDPEDPWSKVFAARPTVARRIKRFLASPAKRQYIALALRARRMFPEMAIPLRLPFGAWWLAEKGALDHELMYDGFEEAEVRFVQRLLRPGMTVLDIGAHHGLYTLLTAKRVGRHGRVIAFEPSLRECRRLAQHVRVNRCKNVEVEACAVGDMSGEAELFMVDGFRDWGNSLRPPDVPEPTRVVRAPVRKLDDVLAERGIDHVDFIKLDTEGGELAVLEGARRLLQTAPRPAILAEVEDIRTRPWGYPAREIMQLLARWNYRWFALSEMGTLYPASPDDESYDSNYVALPDERAEEFQRLLDAPQDHGFRHGL
ncbi:MAG TPA: FkbM family methyltransferase [Candidatus Acidoferrum sp.]|nr:FkbM family methyltransferase [Candidatus Acidoferrum sp.]